MYYWKGNLCGRICEDCIEPLFGLTVRLYRPSKELEDTADQEPLSRALAILKGSQLEEKSNYLLAEALIDVNGDFSFSLDEDQYQGGPLEIDIYAPFVPGQKEQKETPPARQFTLGIIQPAWDQQEDGMFASLRYCISARFWCAFRALFDAWVICGQVVACADERLAIGGVKVIACDTDYIQDDRLGEALTDAQGRFRIDYSSADFKRTLLSSISSIFDIETPFPPVNTGPDVYFIIETNESEPHMLLNEPRARGKEPERENVSHCFCVRLCAEVEVPDDPTGEEMPTVWTQIGNTFTIPAGGFANDVNADGFGESGGTEFAFHGVIRLLGGAPRYRNGHPIEYRFLISETTTPNLSSPPPVASFTKLVGIGGDSDLFYETTHGAYKIGQMIRFSPYRVVDIFATQADLDLDGWLDVNTSINRVFTDTADLDSADLALPGVWQWKSADMLMAVNTHHVTSEANVPSIAADPGQVVPSEFRIATEQIAIRFEAREVIDKAANSFAPLPGSGHILNRLVINNNSIYRKLAIAEHLSSNSCDALSDTIRIAYNSYHPYLRSLSLHIRSNDYAVNTGLSDPGNIPLPIPLPDEVANSSLLVYNPSAIPPGPIVLHKCTYLVTLTTRLRLHSGDSAQGPGSIHTTFYYDPT